MTDIPENTPEPVPATNQAGEVAKSYTAGFEQGWEWPRETSPTEAAERYARGYVAALATQPATSQEGEDEDAIHDCGNLGWCQAPGCCSRHGTAPTPTPPTLSEDLREALREIRDTTTAVAGLDRHQTEEYYRSIARAALAQVKAS